MPETRELRGTAPAAALEGGRRWWTLVVMCVAQLMVILDATIVTIALPSAQADLGFSTADRQWVVTAFALTFGSFLLIGGRLVDLLGRRTAVLVGLAGFGLASALGGAAGSFEVLVAARGLQGLFGAVLAPATLAIVTTTFHDGADRDRAFSIFGGVSAAGAATGLLLGGVLTEFATWRWTLYVNLAFAAVGILGALALLTHERLTLRRGNDVPGTTAITVGLFLLVFGFSSAERRGWADTSTVLLLVAGVLLVGVFVLIERSAAHPALPLRILASRTRSGSLVVLFLGGVALFSELLFLAYYLQESLGYKPVQAGLAFLPQSAGVVVAVTVGSAYLGRRASSGTLVATGLVVAAAGMLLLSRISGQDRYVTLVLPALVLVGFGLGLSLVKAIDLGLAGVEDEDAGVASAAVNAVQQIGGTLGPSLFSTVAASALAGYLADNAGRDPARTPREAAVLDLAIVQGYSLVFAIAAATLLVGAVVGAVLLRAPSGAVLADAEPAGGRLDEGAPAAA